MGNPTYKYDADGRRIQKILASGDKSDFVYDLGGKIVTEFYNGGWARGYVHAGGRLLATYVGGGTQFSHADWLGTERVRTTATGSVYNSCASLPFGDGLSCTGGTDYVPLHFTGKERDAETGLDYFGARYLSSAQGRWMSPDWSATPQAVPYADLRDPQTLNLYSYVRNNPLSRADLDGHDDDDTKKKIAQGAQGAAASAGTQGTQDAAVRARYVDASSKIQTPPGTYSPERTALKVEARAASTPASQTIAETMRPIAKDAEMAAQGVGNAAKTNAGVNAAMESVGQAGPVLMVVAAGASTYNVATATDKPRAIAQEGGSWAGALTFGTLGAKGGAVVGAFVGGPVGAAIGGVVGAVGGGIVGGITGSRAATSAYDYFHN